MTVKLNLVRCSLPPFFLLLLASVCKGQAVAPSTPAQAQAMVERALGNELHGAQNRSQPMRYRLHKSSPRLSSTKELVETRDGSVARLLSVNDKPLSAIDEQKEQARLDGLLGDPSRQRHRQQSENDDTARALKVLRALPKAFLYQFAGSEGRIQKFNFRPNPSFNPPDLETQVLTAMSGEILIDPVEDHVVRLEGRLEKDVDFGWGVLGRLYKGGWITLDQADVGGHQWRIVHFQMAMTGRVLFKNKSFDTVEATSDFAPVPVGLNYRQAIQMLRADPSGR